ncbi:caspase family protein [Variovorax sp. J22R24]|uniref:caspase family protein n=1 Tax=Variovorax gracilis TaxID=3053502 RepID=UPI002574E23C|nr:caspase family protein [Variovorax sp. J22R24]MDM0109847.1 caspase family protein [Variovorax sp. J22R24]
MRANDLAILVGISKYYSPTFKELSSPLNDVELMKDWLLRKDGGNMDPNRVFLITTTADRIADKSWRQWRPSLAEFKDAFDQRVTDQDGKFIRQPGRLYLYFSGHGFAEWATLKDRGSMDAALVSANSVEDTPDNICGSFFAQVAHMHSLFEEIVLIMDCCRNASVKSSYARPAYPIPVFPKANSAKGIAIFAAPHGSSTPERAFGERGGKVYGILTNALISCLETATPDDSRGLSSLTLMKQLDQRWHEFSDDPTTSGFRFSPMDSEMIFFNASSKLLTQRICLSHPLTAATTVIVSDGKFNTLFTIWLQNDVAVLRDRAGNVAPLPISSENEFSVLLEPGLFRVILAGDRSGEQLFQSSEGAHVKL